MNSNGGERACGLAGVSRRRLSYVSRKDDGALAAELKELAAAHPRYGSRRLCVMLRRERGRVVNLKKVRRLCREHGLLLGARRRRKRRGVGVGCRAGPSTRATSGRTTSWRTGRRRAASCGS